jgi:acetolactate synthase small subunit
LNVAPTASETVSRLTLVTSGPDNVIDQISKQLGKLVDVVDIADMTADHIERGRAVQAAHWATAARTNSRRAEAIDAAC